MVLLRARACMPQLAGSQNKPSSLLPLLLLFLLLQFLLLPFSSLRSSLVASQDARRRSYLIKVMEVGGAINEVQRLIKYLLEGA